MSSKLFKRWPLAYPLDIQLFAEGDGGGEDNPPTNDDGTGTGEESEIKTFTQEDVDKIVQGRIAKERKAWEKKIEDDKTEASKLADMSDAQKKKYQEEKRVKDLEEREQAITRRELTAQAKEQLAEKGLPLSLANILDYSNAEKCNESIEEVEKAFRESVQSNVEDRIKGGKPIKKATDDKTTDAEMIYKNMMGK